jgi:hypothetical protein
MRIHLNFLNAFLLMLAISFSGLCFGEEEIYEEETYTAKEILIDLIQSIKNNGKSTEKIIIPFIVNIHCAGYPQAVVVGAVEGEMEIFLSLSDSPDSFLLKDKIIDNHRALLTFKAPNGDMQIGVDTKAGTIFEIINVKSTGKKSKVFCEVDE